MNGWHCSIAAFLTACTGASALAGTPTHISEVRLNESGVDVNDFVEIDGTPGTSMNNMTYVVISRGDDPAANGVIEHAYALSGTIPASGHYVVAGLDYTLSIADLTIPDFEFFASDNKTHLLVTGFTGVIGDDLDTNEDGVLDLTPWRSVVDSVAIVLNTVPTGNNGNSWVYSDTLVGPDGVFVPGHVYVCADTAEWEVGLFSPVGQTDRPNETNLSCTIEVPNVRINEVRIDQPLTDNDEYFELKGPALQTLNGLSYIVIGDGSAALGSGVIEAVIPLTGLEIPADGHFLAVEDTSTAPLGQVNLITDLPFENGDNVTHILVAGFDAGFGVGDDLDTNDDGVLDITPWQAIVDLVAVIRQNNPPTSTEFHYAQNTDQIVGPTIDNNAPMQVFRCEPDGTWTIGADDVGISDTFGTLNLACAGDVCGMPRAGDCFANNGSAGCNDGKCCNIVCAIDPTCCNVIWDETCAQLAEFNCAGGDPCGNPDAGSCYAVHIERGCDNAACCDQVCAMDPMCCSVEWDMACVDLADKLCTVVGPPPVVRINELRTDEPGTNANEYFELKGASGTSLAGVSYIVIGDGAGLSGEVESVTHLDGNLIPADGHFLVAEDNDTLGVAADLIAIMNFENDDNVTHMIVFNFTGSVGDDLDGNNDGTLDLTPWDAVIDSVALLATPLPPSQTGEEYVYSATQLGPIDGFAPAHAYRCETDGTWVVGRFDWDDNNDSVPDGADTPGSLNLACAPKSCGSPFAGDCFSANGTPGCEVSECCDAVCQLDPFCCEVAWDESCAANAAVTCAPPCGGPNAENCFQANTTGSGGCENPICCDIVCSLDPMCCTNDWDAACATLATNNCLFGGTPPALTLNEVRIDQPGADNDEYFEIKAAPGTSLNGVHLIVIGDGTGGSGSVEAWVDLSGQTVPADGHFLCAEPTLSLVPIGNADYIIAQQTTGNSYGLNFENGDNVTFMLVYDFTGSIDTDIDGNDDGTIDSPTWASLIDSIALVENIDMPPTGTEWWYGPFVGPDDIFVPGHVYRCETDGTWIIGTFDPVGGSDTPGTLNPDCVGGGDCLGDIVDSGTFLPPPDGEVDGADLGFLLTHWGPNPGDPADFVGSDFNPPPDGVVDGADLGILLQNWGPCP